MASLSHRQGWSFAVALALFPCVFFASDTSDAPMVTYRTGTSEVRVSFFATEGSSRLVETVNRDDFAVVDNDLIIREFRSLTRSGETALDIIVLVDTSESVAGRFGAVRESVVTLVGQGNQFPSDNISVVTFSGQKPGLVCERLCSSESVDRRLGSINPAGPTPLFDALVFTTQFIRGRTATEARPVIILFSDGMDTISRASPRDVMEQFTATGALLYAVDLNSSTHDSVGQRWLDRMAETTGGRSFYFHDYADKLLQEVLAELRASYVVTYALPSHAAGFHSLRILPKHNQNLRFHCRSGYLYEDQ